MRQFPPLPATAQSAPPFQSAARPELASPFLTSVPGGVFHAFDLCSLGPILTLPFQRSFEPVLSAFSWRPVVQGPHLTLESKSLSCVIGKDHFSFLFRLRSLTRELRPCTFLLHCISTSTGKTFCYPTSLGSALPLLSFLSIAM